LSHSQSFRHAFQPADVYPSGLFRPVFLELCEFVCVTHQEN
jgi:hypothetical protein